MRTWNDDCDCQTTIRSLYLPFHLVAWVVSLVQLRCSILSLSVHSKDFIETHPIVLICFNHLAINLDMERNWWVNIGNIRDVVLCEEENEPNRESGTCLLSLATIDTYYIHGHYKAKIIIHFLFNKAQKAFNKIRWPAPTSRFSDANYSIIFLPSLFWTESIFLANRKPHKINIFKRKQQLKKFT